MKGNEVANLIGGLFALYLVVMSLIKTEWACVSVFIILIALLQGGLVAFFVWVAQQPFGRPNDTKGLKGKALEKAQEANWSLTMTQIMRAVYVFLALFVVECVVMGFAYGWRDYTEAYWAENLSWNEQFGL